MLVSPWRCLDEVSVACTCGLSLLASFGLLLGVSGGSETPQDSYTACVPSGFAHSE